MARLANVDPAWLDMFPPVSQPLAGQSPSPGLGGSSGGSAVIVTPSGSDSLLLATGTAGGGMAAAAIRTVQRRVMIVADGAAERLVANLFGGYGSTYDPINLAVVNGNGMGRSALRLRLRRRSWEIAAPAILCPSELSPHP